MRRSSLFWAVTVIALAQNSFNRLPAKTINKSSRPAITKATPSAKAPVTARVPREILRFMPKQGKSRAFATLPITFQNQPVKAHFYDVKPMANIGKSDWDYDTQFCALDLFIGGGKRRFSRIKSVPLKYARWKDRNDLAKVEFRWLDSVQKTKPIINVQLGNFGSMFKTRINGSDILIIFPDGLSGKPVVQRFGFGIYTVGPIESCSISYGTDEQGFLTIEQTESSSEGERTKLWKWNGKALAITENKLRTWEQISQEP